MHIRRVTTESHTTAAIAKKVGVTRATIQQWIKDGRIRPPKIQAREGKPPVRLWSQSAIASLRKLKEEMKLRRIRKPKED
jgi:predicted site-specific integrase-resolvase